MDVIEMFGLLIAGGSLVTVTLAALLRLERIRALRSRSHVAPAATAPAEGGATAASSREPPRQPT